jgi:hypothetical protein
MSADNETLEDTEVNCGGAIITMRDRRVRTAFVGLILLFPVLMAVSGPRQSLNPRTGLLVLGVEAVLAVGLLAAARERKLLHARRASGARNRPHVLPPARGADVRATTH